jgi:NhaA family Na+:H+ antiporter
LVVVGVVASIGFTVSLFFATTAFSEGAALAETKMGALLSFVAAPLAVVVSRVVRVRALEVRIEAHATDSRRNATEMSGGKTLR